MGTCNHGGPSLRCHLVKQQISMFTLGGTIAMTPGTASGAVVPKLAAADLLRAIPELAGLPVELSTHDFRRLPSPDIGFTVMAELATAIEGAIGAGADGIVVTQGTDTIEETCY